MLKYLMCYFLIVNFCSEIIGYKFLVYSPKIGGSRIGFFGKLADILVDAGHDVTVYEPTINANLSSKSIGSKKAKIVDRPCDFEVLFQSSNEQIQTAVWTVDNFGFSAMTNRFSLMFGTMKNACRNQLLDESLMEMLKNEKFDVAFGDIFDPCFFAVVEKLKIKTHVTVFATSPIDILYSALGIPATPSFAPTFVMSDVPDLGYMTRFKNLLAYLGSNYWFSNKVFAPFEDVVYETMGIKNFDIAKKAADSAFIFANADEFTDFPRPSTNKIVNIGGFGMGKAKPLEPEYEKIFGTAKKGVIFVSFGSIAQAYRMPAEMKKKFLATFEKFPDVNFIWKYEKEEDNITQGYKNVFAFKWLPQMDLLEHPKLLGFVSHGGMNSVTEGSSRGVPMICVPLFAEQQRNANMLKYRGAAVVVEKSNLVTTNDLENAIRSILDDSSYRTNAKKLSAMVRAKPMGPEDRIVKYAEFAAEFGNANNLDMEGRHLNFIQFYCLDIILPFILLAIIIFWAIVKIIKFLIRKFVFGDNMNYYKKVE